MSSYYFITGGFFFFQKMNIPFAVMVCASGLTVVLEWNRFT